METQKNSRSIHALTLSLSSTPGNACGTGTEGTPRFSETLHAILTELHAPRRRDVARNVSEPNGRDIPESDNQNASEPSAEQAQREHRVF